MHRLLAAVLLPLILPAVCTAQIKAVSLVQNLVFPLHVCAPPGDTDRLFIVGQQGTIQILENGSLLPQPFLDITTEVNSDAGEQGLLGLAFDPDYDVNGYFYVNFITGAGAGKSVIRRYTVSANPDSADESSGHQLLELTQVATNHNGGNLVFGPDGYLWTGFGDGGAGGFRSQDPQLLFGKLLRIDPDGDDFPADSLRNYAIPPGNPFIGDPTTLDEIWALGLRNPWRFSFDALTGDLYIGDVGKDAFEEISFEAAGSPGGLNFGWDLMEGFECFNPPTDCDDGSLTHPIHTWPHGKVCNSATGGYVYRGSELAPWLYGHYFFADYCQPAVWSFRYENGMVTEFRDWTATLDIGGAVRFPASFWEDDAGELYLVEYRASLGEIWKIVPDSSVVAVPPAAVPAVGRLRLDPARPNPFTGSTTFDLHLDRAGVVEASVFDSAGRLVRRLHSGPASPGLLSLTWEGRDRGRAFVPAGVYFLRVRTEDGIATRRVTRLR